MTKFTGCTVAMETRSKKGKDNSKLSKVNKKKPPRVISNVVIDNGLKDKKISNGKGIQKPKVNIKKGASKVKETKKDMVEV